MPTFKFLPPQFDSPEGIVAVGGTLDPDSVISAYRVGIFPWPIEGLPLTWFCPHQRGILEFSRLRIPRSLAKDRARSPWKITIDNDCPAVIRACAEVERHGEDGTWIIPEMIESYCTLHHMGYVHSVEVWDGEELVGGLYGVEVDGVFSGESMFHRRTGASKFALLHLVDCLRARGAAWIDTQTESPLMSLLGGRTIPRDEYLQLLSTTQARGLKLID